MKILLVGINSKFIHSNPAVYYLRTYAIDKSQDKNLFSDSVKIAEYTINQEKGDVLRDIYRQGADVIAFSCYLWNISYIYSLITSIAKISPDTHIWLGGPEVSFDPEMQLEKYPMVRGIIAGEGEASFYKLVCEYMYNGMENALPRVLYAEELDFDEVPFPYENFDDFKNRIIYYETSRGCPFGCSYCLSSVDTRVRLRNIELVRKELKAFMDAGITQVKFVDRTFNCNPGHTLDILTFIRDNDNGITNFHFEMAAELITEEEMKILETLRPGAVQIEIGIQTTNCDTLKAINRRADMKHLSAIVNRLLSFKNMHVHVDLIAGLPYEDLESFRKSFNDVYALHANELQLGFLKVLKGSPMEKEASEYGIEYSAEPPYEVLKTNWISFGDIVELKAVEEMVEVYYNSGQFVNTMELLEKVYPSDAYSLYKEIADYYARLGYDKVSHSRYDRYRILLDFVSGYFKDDTVLEDITESLLHDLYLRDNVKSRPGYGTSGLVDKQEYHDFFESGRYREYLVDYGEYTSTQVSKMVHIEKRRDGYMLYDYRKRSPLDGNATCYHINRLN